MVHATSWFNEKKKVLNFAYMIINLWLNLVSNSANQTNYENMDQDSFYISLLTSACIKQDKLLFKTALLKVNTLSQPYSTLVN